MNPFATIKPFLVKHEPEILMSMGIAGLLFSTVWGVKATIKATKMVENKEADLKKPLNFKETAKLTWKLYIPVVASAVISVPCIIAGNRVSSKRYAAIATAYTISETALQEYQLKTREIVGEKKEKEILESISNDKVEKTYKPGTEIIMTGDGESLFYEPLSGRYFKSSWNKISKAANELNSKAMAGLTGNVCLNDWFYSIGLDATELGDTIGWNLMNGTKSLINIQISSHINKDDIPCGAIYYVNQPGLLKDY